VIGTGEVVVDVAAAPVLSYADEVFSGERRYMVDLPVIPGCGAIGRVRETGPDATKLKVGDRVFCDPTVRDHGPVGFDPHRGTARRLQRGHVTFALRSGNRG
jgi:NADPH:quinone reductase-like Zn-dependent oxidoreductase